MAIQIICRNIKCDPLRCIQVAKKQQQQQNSRQLRLKGQMLLAISRHRFTFRKVLTYFNEP